MPMPTKSVVLYDAVGPANATHSTGALDVSDFDAILVEEAPVGGAAAASTLFLRDLGNASQSVVGALATTADSNPNLAGWGVGVGAVAMTGGLYYKGGVPAPLPTSIAAEIGALGVGISARIRIVGRRNFRGSVEAGNTLNGTTPRALD